MLHVVTYQGPFGFIKPAESVRSGEIFSLRFLTPSIISGIESYLFEEEVGRKVSSSRIKRHRLTYKGLSQQKEIIQAAGWNYIRIAGERVWARIAPGKKKAGMLVRNVMIDPKLSLAFEEEQDAIKASKMDLCLCRNEDVLFPVSIQSMTEDVFELQPGFELLLGDGLEAVCVGINRYTNKPQYGTIKYTP